MSPRTITWLLWISAAACLFVIAALFAAKPASAHSWYSPQCCSGKDCEPIPRDALVEERRDGSGWDVEFISAHYGYVKIFFPRHLMRDSQDGGFHACIRPDLVPLCIYVPINT